METRRNTLIVLAKFLRAGVRDVRASHGETSAGTPFVNDQSRYANGLESIGAVADALEEQANASDSAQGTT